MYFRQSQQLLLISAASLIYLDYYNSSQLVSLLSFCPSFPSLFHPSREIPLEFESYFISPLLKSLQIISLFTQSQSLLRVEVLSEATGHLFDLAFPQDPFSASATQTSFLFEHQSYHYHVGDLFSLLLSLVTRRECLLDAKSPPN
nr:V-type proton ATPase subunit e 1 isoform X1 [Aotus nancymaae]